MVQICKLCWWKDTRGMCSDKSLHDISSYLDERYPSYRYRDITLHQYWLVGKSDGFVNSIIMIKREKFVFSSIRILCQRYDTFFLTDNHYKMTYVPVRIDLPARWSGYACLKFTIYEICWPEVTRQPSSRTDNNPPSLFLLMLGWGFLPIGPSYQKEGGHPSQLVLSAGSKGSPAHLVFPARRVSLLSACPPPVDRLTHMTENMTYLLHNKMHWSGLIYFICLILGVGNIVTRTACANYGFDGANNAGFCCIWARDIQVCIN